MFLHHKSYDSAWPLVADRGASAQAFGLSGGAPGTPLAAKSASTLSFVRVCFFCFPLSPPIVRPRPPLAQLCAPTNGKKYCFTSIILTILRCLQRPSGAVFATFLARTFVFWASPAWPEFDSFETKTGSRRRPDSGRFQKCYMFGKCIFHVFCRPSGGGLCIVK